MATVIVQCAWCGKDVEKSSGEVKRSRKMGRRFFCDLSCTAKLSNQPRRSQKVLKVCPVCFTEFVSSTHNKAASYCSRSCASKGSMTEKRREAQRRAGHAHKDNLRKGLATALRNRESWKYAKLRKALDRDGREYEFEHEVAGRIFDLALLDKQILVEFDGPDHNGARQIRDDRKKQKVAEKYGFTVVRRTVRPAEAIPAKILQGL